jgi:hypothetical protein
VRGRARGRRVGSLTNGRARARRSGCSRGLSWLLDRPSIGSSNTGYRSLTYDSELNCDVVDGQIVRGARRYARNLRVELWREHLRLGPGGGPLLLDPRRGFAMLRAAAEGDLARAHGVAPYDPAYIGDDLTEPGAPPLYDPTNPNHEIVRTQLIDPDARNPNPLLDYFALLALI